MAIRELVRTVSQSGVCCERCPGATAENTRHITRRRLLKTAVFQPQAPPAYPGYPTGAGRQPGGPVLAGPMPGGMLIDDSRAADLYRTVSGQVIDVSPHVITIGDSAGERRFTLTAAARAWRGSATDPAVLHPGDDVVIRLLRSRPSVADRVWANIGRVTGTITEQHRDHLVVTEGATRRQQVVVIPPYASRRVEVRFPTLRPGYLLDLIGIRRADYLEAIIPATSQPTYRADMTPLAQRYTGRMSDAVSGSAVWHDSAEEPYGVLGVRYPAVDPATGCAEDASAGYRPGEAPAVRDLPYLAVGSMLNVRNECAGIAWTLPVTGCAPVARLFNDRCVTCHTSPRGRIADLTMASFIALGGEPETGCFNATLAIGR